MLVVANDTGVLVELAEKITDLYPHLTTALDMEAWPRKVMVVTDEGELYIRIEEDKESVFDETDGTVFEYSEKNSAQVVFNEMDDLGYFDLA